MQIAYLEPIESYSTELDLTGVKLLVPEAQ